MIVDNEMFVVHWLDEAQTILLCEVKHHWTWESAHEIIDIMNKQCENANHGVYTVYHFQNDTSVLPTGGYAISNVRRLMSIESENDELYIFIGRHQFVVRLIDIASKIYGLREALSRFRFVNDLSEALKIIEEHKQKIT